MGRWDKEEEGYLLKQVPEDLGIGIHSIDAFNRKRKSSFTEKGGNSEGIEADKIHSRQEGTKLERLAVLWSHLLGQVEHSVHK